MNANQDIGNEKRLQSQGHKVGLINLVNIFDLKGFDKGIYLLHTKSTCIGTSI